MKVHEAKAKCKMLTKEVIEIFLISHIQDLILENSPICLDEAGWKTFYGGLQEHL